MPRSSSASCDIFIRRPEPPPGWPLACDPHVAAKFAEVVSAMLDGQVLRYSQRAKLLAKARQMGIARFEANLIIAMVIHQQPDRGGETASHVVLEPKSRLQSTLLLGAFALAIQAIIVITAWRLFLA